MIRGLMSKELLEGVYGYKFLLSFVLAIVVIPMSLYLGTAKYKAAFEEYLEANRAGIEAVREQPPKPPHSAAHFGISVSKPPSPLQAFAAGVDDVLGQTTKIDPHRTPRLTGGTAERTPLLVMYGKLDYAFVIQVVFGLFALVLSFDVISGERENGTLKMILSNSIPRSNILMGKLLGGSLLLLVPVLLATLLGLLFFTPIFGMTLTSDQWLRVALIVGLSMLYLVMMFLLGVVASTLTQERISSLILLLLLWVGMIFIVPRTTAGLAERLAPIPSSQEVEGQIEEIQQAEVAAMRQRIRDFLAENPDYTTRTIPADFMLENRRQMDEAVETQEAKVHQEIDVVKARQVGLATNLARLSPATSYLLSATDLAGTGVESHRRFLEFLDEYRISFRSHFDELESLGFDTVEEFDTVPRFDYRPESVDQVLSRVVWDIGLLVVTCSILFAIAHVAFLRYDAR